MIRPVLTEQVKINKADWPILDGYLIPPDLYNAGGCESSGGKGSVPRQFDKKGNLIRGPDGHDVGAFQIRETVHGERAKKLGMNIYELQGNIAFALTLYNDNKMRDWKMSERCWK